MNTHCLIPLIATIAYIPLFIVLIFNRPWQRQHKLFAWFLAAAMLWSLTDFLFRSDFLMQDKLLLAKVTLCFFVWGAVQLHYFLFSFYGDFRFPSAYVLMAMLFALVLTRIPESIAIDNGVVPDYGIWIVPLALSLYVLLGRDIYFLWQKLSVLTDPAARNQLVYLLLGTSTLILFASSGLSLFGREFPISHVGSLLNAVILIYAVLKHRLLDMRFVLRQGLVFSTLAGLLLATFMLWLFLIHRGLGFEISFTSTFVAALLTAASAAGFWYQARHFLYRKVDQVFYRESYDYRVKLFDFVRHKISGVFSLQELGGELLPLLVKTLNCRQSYLLLSETGGGDFVALFAEPQEGGDSPLRIRQDSPIVERFRRENRYLNKEDLDILPEFRSLWGEEREKLRSLGIELFFPLVSRGNLIGILVLGKKQSGKYSLEDIDLAERITAEVAVSLEKEYLQEQLRKREEELSLINRLATIITSSLNIQEAYDAFIAELRKVVDVDWATIALIEGDEIYFQALSTEVGSAWQTGERIPLEGTATQRVTGDKKALVEPDLAQKRRFWTGEEYVKRGIRSIVYLPLLVKGEAIGSLIVASRQPSAYSPGQVRLLERLALQIAMQAENARLYGRAEQRARVDELTGLFNRRHFDERLKEEIDRHSRYSGMLSLVLLDLDNFKDYNDKLGHLAGDKLLGQVGRLIKRSFRSADLAFRYGGDEFAILLPQSSADDAFIVAERVRGRIAIEMGGQQVPITASLGLASWPSDGITPDGIVNAADKALYYAKRTGGNRTYVVSRMLPSLAEPVASEANAEKEALNTIYALAATIEARDKYTYGHSRKVGNYAVALAEALDLPSERVAIISTAALLHDIGKIGIPDEVLNKTGKLDDEEWELIKSHPKLSANIVGHVPSLTSCLPAILHHQERWDGTGYPSGLEGEAIPLEARILAVADAFDAMTSSRPYRGPLSYREAVEELKRSAGSQFDPKLVEAFLPIALSTVPEELGVGQNSGSHKAGS